MVIAVSADGTVLGGQTFGEIDGLFPDQTFEFTVSQPPVTIEIDTHQGCISDRTSIEEASRKNLEDGEFEGDISDKCE